MKKITIKTLLVLFLVSITTKLYANNKNEYDTDKVNLLEKIRVTYYEAVENDEKIDELRNIILNNFSEDQSEYSPLILAYFGGIEALKAKHAFWPFTKLSRLNGSMEIFAKAIEMNPESLEIRFMRFSILYYVPGILGFDEEEGTDLEKIISLIIEDKGHELNRSIRNGIINFMIESERLSEEQVEVFKEKIILAGVNE